VHPLFRFFRDIFFNRFLAITCHPNAPFPRPTGLCRGAGLQWESGPTRDDSFFSKSVSFSSPRFYVSSTRTHFTREITRRRSTQLCGQTSHWIEGKERLDTRYGFPHTRPSPFPFFWIYLRLQYLPPLRNKNALKPLIRCCRRLNLRSDRNILLRLTRLGGLVALDSPEHSFFDLFFQQRLVEASQIKYAVSVFSRTRLSNPPSKKSRN